MVDISFLNGILVPISDFVNGLLVSWLGLTEEQVIGLLTLVSLLLLWMKGRMILDFVRTYWNVLGVLIIVLIVGSVLGWI